MRCSLHQCPYQTSLAVSISPKICLTPTPAKYFSLAFTCTGTDRMTTPKKQLNVEKEKRTKEGYSQSYYFPVHSLGTSPSLVCIISRGCSSSTPSHWGLLHHYLNSAAPRWYSKHFSSSAEVAAASWPSKEEVVVAPSSPPPSPRSCSETSWASARNWYRSRSPCRSPRCLRPRTHSRHSRCLSTAWSAG